MKKENGAALALAAVATLVASVTTVRSAGSMTMSMPMPGGWSMSMAWMAMGQQSAVERAAMFLAMWTVMMIAMMLPSAMPAVLLHDRLVRVRKERGEAAGGSQLLLLFGYFTVWAGVGVVAYGLGMVVSSAAMRSAALSRTIPVATGLMLAVAGLYQLTSVKRACLQHCRSPLEFFSRHRIQRAGDSLAFGFHHGAYCAACCWGLMAIQLALGIMSLPLMAIVAAVIFVEKHWKHGESFAVLIGIVAIMCGAVLVLRAAI